MIIQPRLRLDRQLAREQHRLRFRDSDHARQQRVIGGFHPRAEITGRSRRFDPVVLSRERVRRQLDRPARTAVLIEPLRPIHLDAVAVQVRQGPHEALELAHSVAQAGTHRDRLATPRPALRGHRRQHAARSQLERHRRACAFDRMHPIQEAHRLPHVPRPVIGARYTLTLESQRPSRSRSAHTGVVRSSASSRPR